MVHNSNKTKKGRQNECVGLRCFFFQVDSGFKRFKSTIDMVVDRIVNRQRITKGEL